MKIAIIRLSSLGDIIHALWTVQFVKKRFPESEITWICDSFFKDIVKCCPYVDRVIHIPLRNRSFSKSIKTLYSLSKEKFDYVIDMQGLIKSAIVSRIISKEVYGFSKDSAREKYSSLFYKYKFNIPYKKNIFLRNLELISGILKIEISESEFNDYSPYLIPNNKNNINDLFIVNSNKNLIFIPSATTPERVVPVEKYAELMNRIDENCYIIYGNNEEYKKCQKIKELCSKLIIIPKLSISELISLFSHADCIIGPDTGPSNIPFAVKTPSITIYWDKAKNSYKRNTFHTRINKAISFNDLSNFDARPIVLMINEIIY